MTAVTNTSKFSCLSDSGQQSFRYIHLREPPVSLFNPGELVTITERSAARRHRSCVRPWPLEEQGARGRGGGGNAHLGVVVVGAVEDAVWSRGMVMQGARSLVRHVMHYAGDGRGVSHPHRAWGRGALPSAVPS